MYPLYSVNVNVSFLEADVFAIHLLTKQYQEIESGCNRSKNKAINENSTKPSSLS